MQILRLFEINVFIVKKVFIVSLELHKKIFSRSILHKNKPGKNLHFLQKPWTNSFGKMQIWGLF